MFTISNGCHRVLVKLSLKFPVSVFLLVYHPLRIIKITHIGCWSDVYHLLWLPSCACEVIARGPRVSNLVSLLSFAYGLLMVTILSLRSTVGYDDALLTVLVDCWLWSFAYSNWWLWPFALVRLPLYNEPLFVVWCCKWIVGYGVLMVIVFWLRYLVYISTSLMRALILYVLLKNIHLHTNSK